MKMEQTERSETSKYKIQTPGNHPKESIKQSTFRFHVQLVLSLQSLVNVSKACEF